MTQTDDELLERARAGSNEALAELLERHGPAVRAGLRGMIPARWRSLLSEDDVMQQTYADAALGLDRFESRDAFQGWLAAQAILRAGPR
jgi:DNA-directed RNA polymerase specialized sigma24 family protein